MWFDCNVRVEENIMKLNSITLALALTVLVGCAAAPMIPKDQWRQTAVTDADTVFPGIKYGMTVKQVRALVPAEYTVIDDQNAILEQSPELSQFNDDQGRPTKFLRLDRLHEEEGVIEVDHFVFVDGRLTQTLGGYGRPSM